MVAPRASNTCRARPAPPPPPSPPETAGLQASDSSLFLSDVSLSSGGTDRGGGGGGGGANNGNPVPPLGGAFDSATKNTGSEDALMKAALYGATQAVRDGAMAGGSLRTRARRR